MKLNKQRSIQEMYGDLGMITYNITVYESALQALKEQKQELLNQIHSENTTKQPTDGSSKASSTDMGTAESST
jgi:hypothetical protein